jgi:hypothetical protein
MEKTLYTIMILVVLMFVSTVAMAQEPNPPLTDEEMFDFNIDESVEGGEEGNHPTIVAPKVIDKATGEVLIEELLLAQVIGGGVVIMTYAMNGEFQETEMAWTKIKVLTPDNQECGIPDLQHVQCPGLDEWNKTIEEIVQ